MSIVWLFRIGHWETRSVAFQRNKRGLVYLRHGLNTAVMVYCGKASEGCQNCRKRRIKVSRFREAIFTCLCTNSERCHVHRFADMRSLTLSVTRSSLNARNVSGRLCNARDTGISSLSCFVMRAQKSSGKRTLNGVTTRKLRLRPAQPLPLGVKES